MSDDHDQHQREPLREEYIGDGCYASFDGFYIKLRAPRFSGNHEVYLEPAVFDSLLAFARRLHWVR